MNLTMRLLLMISMLFGGSTAWSKMRYSEVLCNKPDYSCITIKSNQTWSSLYPNPEEQDIIRRVNRMNVRLRPGMIIAIPKNIDRLSIYDVSPFPRYIESEGEKTVYVSQKNLAWGAYDADGELVWWGPISSGIDGCHGITGTCQTPSGSFRIIRKQDIDCVSTAFPRRADGNNGGAVMPYCMHFFKGYALHGSYDVPGYRASHGCVRMLIEDARWLNEEFVSTAQEDGKGTLVILDAPS
jgi:hypothetical protein